MANIRQFKGSCVHYFPRDYTVVDIETTGLCAMNADILEVSAIRCREMDEVARFSTLVKQRYNINPLITELTGITDEMAKMGAPILDTLIHFKDFVQDDIILGFNINFDINFLYDNFLWLLDEPFTNDFYDVLRLARIKLPYLSNHKQVTVAQYFGVDTRGSHRAANDCHICNEIYKKLLEK